MPMFHYVPGVYCYLYFDQMHVNLIRYLYPFMLNKICLSLSLSLYYLSAHPYVIHFKYVWDKRYIGIREKNNKVFTKRLYVY